MGNPISVKYAALIIFTLLFIFSLSISGASEKIKVAASFYPLAHFAEHVGGEHADVMNIMPPGAEPHEFEPTPKDIRKIYESDIFLFHGAGLDPWAERVRNDLKRKGTYVLEMAEHISSVQSDPHIWLDPLLAIKEVEVIRDSFIEVDAVHMEAYREKSGSYIHKLNELHERFVSGLKDCATRDIIVSHNAFNYMAARYSLNVHAITGISPEEEPSPRKMVELARLAGRMNIKYIFFEELLTPRLAETLAGEVGAETLVLNPLGGLTMNKINEGGTYISVMEDNLGNLRIAMECQ
jgi:zinc transport system substrate-binding protein